VSEAVHLYHDGTKHHIHRFARSLGYLDWASQPNPFRSFLGAAAFALPPRPDVPAHLHGQVSAAVIGDVLRHSLGLSAWKQFGESRPSAGSGRREPVERRWSLRVNPSSGNLHPTEAYFVSGPLSGLASSPAVYHYAPDRHALEQRCVFDDRAWNRATSEGPLRGLVALTSIHWREAWKYGERAFRYCQHDMGHAIAAVRIAAERVGLDARLLPGWSHRDIAALTGIDRAEDFVEAEREEAGCLIGLRPRAPGLGPQASGLAGRSLVDAIRSGMWSGRASQVSEAHVEWSFIDDIARATEDPGRPSISPALSADAATVYPASVILRRRSAVAFDGRSSIDADRFFTMLSRVMPVAGSPFDALWWDARIHLALFVHRVDGLDPGIYLLARNPAAIDRLRAAFGREFLWESVSATLPLVRLARGECRALARRLSCDQDIAADGFFSLGMIADFDASLNEFGPSFYRHLFWESGVVGQVLYLEAESAGARATGIGCFYDDSVHDVFGLAGHGFQSLYHFTVGMPVDDARLMTEPGYPWESRDLRIEPRASAPNRRRTDR